MAPNDEVGKLFAGGLSWNTTQETLGAFFGNFGEVMDCIVMKNNETGRSRGFGFVTFKDPSSVDLVLSAAPHTLDGRIIDIKTCTPRGARNGGGTGDRKPAAAGPRFQKPKDNYPKIFLGGLPSNPTPTEMDLSQLFSRYGKVMDVVIVYDQETKRSKGYGFLSFESEESVKEVCAEHFVTINGKRVECKMVEPREARANSSQGGASQWNNSSASAAASMGMTGYGQECSSIPEAVYQAALGMQNANGYLTPAGYHGWVAPQAGYGYGGSVQYTTPSPYGYTAGMIAAYPMYNWNAAASSMAPTATTAGAMGDMTVASVGQNGAGTIAGTQPTGAERVTNTAIQNQGYHPYRRQ